MKISVYQTFNGYRVVAGDHRKAQDHLNIQPRTYADAATAYRTETDDKIKASILRIDLSAAQGSTPINQHYINLKPSVTDTNQDQRRMYRAQSIIEKARRDGVEIDASNIVDLLADNLTGWSTENCRYIAVKLGFDVLPALLRKQAE